MLLTNIQILRAFAALNVVFLHVVETGGSYDQGVRWLFFLEEWGASGVDIFFVISGFVMVYTQANKPKTAARFLYNRFVRIVPLYWALTLGLLPKRAEYK